MNDRIKKCLTQAGIYDGREGLYWCSQELLDKFAKLIVRECIETIELNTSHISKRGIGEIHTIVKQHFGVEE